MRGGGGQDDGGAAFVSPDSLSMGGKGRAFFVFGAEIVTSRCVITWVL